MKLTKDQLQKLILSGIGFVVLVYVYSTFFLGPLNKSRDSMLVTIKDLQTKIGASKNEMHNATTLEGQATAATNRFAALKALSPEGAPIAWFPPRIKTFFAKQNIEKSSTRLDNSSAFKQSELSAWIKNTWQIDLPQADFETLGKAVAQLESTEPLLSITRLNIKTAAEDPQFQQAALSASTIMVKR